MRGEFLGVVLAAAIPAAGPTETVSAADVAMVPEEVVKELEASNNVLVREMREFKASPAMVLLDEDGRRTLDRAIAFFGRYRRIGRSPEELVGFFNGLSKLVGGRPGAEGVDGNATWRYSPPCNLERGDVVLARSLDVWSDYFARTSLRDKRFSHIAVVLSGGRDPVLVETGDGPDGETRFMKRKWEDVCGGSVDCAVYRYDGDSAVRSRIGDEAEKSLGIMFDSVFDLKTKKRLYCAEMVRNAVNAATGRETIGTSKKGDFEYVAIDDCYRTGFVKVFDAREWKPPRQEEVANPLPGPALHNASGTKASGSSATNRTTRIRIVPMH